MGKNPANLTVVANPSEPASFQPRPPRKLGKHGLALWNSIQAEFHITDAGGIEVLAQACAAVDRAEGLRIRIDSEGETFRTRSGIRPHPCLKDELAARSFVARSLGRLGVLDEPQKALGRPGKAIGWSPFDAD
jgi:hypothetical protein